MSITKILAQSKDTASDSAKIEAVAVIVAAARKAYGNCKEDITAPEIATTDGATQLEYCSDSTKISLIERETKSIKMCAMETSKTTQGVNLNKLVESLIATSPLLVNISNTTNFDYL
jgi:hypothetical protein